VTLWNSKRCWQFLLTFSLHRWSFFSLHLRVCEMCRKHMKNKKESCHNLLLYVQIFIFLQVDNIVWVAWHQAIQHSSCRSFAFHCKHCCSCSNLVFDTLWMNTTSHMFVWNVQQMILMHSKQLENKLREHCVKSVGEWVERTLGQIGWRRSYENTGSNWLENKLREHWVKFVGE
jgi:hypothetical protein